MSRPLRQHGCWINLIIRATRLRIRHSITCWIQNCFSARSKGDYTQNYDQYQRQGDENQLLGFRVVQKSSQPQRQVVLVLVISRLQHYSSSNSQNNGDTARKSGDATSLSWSLELSKSDPPACFLRAAMHDRQVRFQSQSVEHTQRWSRTTTLIRLLRSLHDDSPEQTLCAPGPRDSGLCLCCLVRALFQVQVEVQL